MHVYINTNRMQVLFVMLIYEVNLLPRRLMFSHMSLKVLALS